MLCHIYLGVDQVPEIHAGIHFMVLMGMGEGRGEVGLVPLDVTMAVVEGGVCTCFCIWASLVALEVKNLLANAGDIRDVGLILGLGCMATHSSILAWKIPRTEEPGGLQSMGSHRVGRTQHRVGRTQLKHLSTQALTHAFVFNFKFSLVRSKASFTDGKWKLAGFLLIF